MVGRKRKLGPKEWIEGIALDIMRSNLPSIVKPGDWVRMGLYLVEGEACAKRLVPRRAKKGATWTWKEHGPVVGFYWHEVDAWAPKEGFK